MAVQEKWSSRDLERQFKMALFERALLQPARVTAALTQMQPQAYSAFKDAYMVEFWACPMTTANPTCTADCSPGSRPS